MAPKHGHSIEKPNSAFSCQVGEGVLQLRFVEQLIPLLRQISAPRKLKC